MLMAGSRDERSIHVQRKGYVFCKWGPPTTGGRGEGRGTDEGGEFLITTYIIGSKSQNRNKSIAAESQKHLRATKMVLFIYIFYIRVEKEHL